MTKKIAENATTANFASASVTRRLYCAALSPPILYLHGFASGPGSTKGVAFERHFAARGIAVRRLDLRVPSFPHLRLSAMLATVRAAITGDVVLIGSSLGGLAAARAAEREPRVRALILLAPAFQLAARWRAQLGPAWDAWRASGWREVTDYTTGQPARVDFGFVEEVAAIDVGWPDVRAPTLILHGRGDDVVPAAQSRQFAAGRPNVRLIELDDGHELVASLPRLLAEAEAFLAAI
ncbi:MAG TPA: YqiA/YcfP family alpha/beta fold hydrolase [Kofleriaceae bacterium]|nr:YqiA/YcfP family alpha/beta fold hydrolase [Kofleriaceae bacterium]